MAAKVYEVKRICDPATKVIVALPIDEYEHLMSFVNLFSDFAQYNLSTSKMDIKKDNITNIVSKLCGTHCDNWTIIE